MRLVSISVENYRSIAKAPKIRLGSSTVLVGPNNEGKSNILRALVAGMNILTSQRSVVRTASGVRLPRIPPRFYDWEKDYPVHLQPRDQGGNRSSHWSSRCRQRNSSPSRMRSRVL